jgi:uncharacterized protein with HEPN domain
MRRDSALLLDMLLAARKIRRYTAGMTLQDFRTNDLVQSGVIRELQVIGEAARNITYETRADYPDIDWQGATGMRNRLVHEYFSVNLDIVWQTVQSNIEPLIVQLEQHVPPDLGLLE